MIDRTRTYDDDMSAAQPSEEYVRALERALCTTLEMPRLCMQKRCRRARRCKGDPAECRALAETILTPEVIEGATLFLSQKIEGGSFDKVVAMSADGLEAFTLWVTHIAPSPPEHTMPTDTR